LGIESGGYRIHRSYNDTDNGTNKKMMSEPTVCLTNIGPKESHKRLVMGICIGILNHLFSGPSNIAGPVGCQSSFCLMKIPMLLGRLGRRSGRRRAKCADPAARVGNRFSAPQIVWNKSNRYKGAWWGAGGQARMGEDFDNHRRIFDGGPSTGLTTGDDF